MGSQEKKLTIFLEQHGGLAAYADIIKAGFTKILIRACLSSKRIHKIDRGLYQLSGGGGLSNPDLVAISIKAPKGVVCLLSALAFHEVTNEIPQCVDIAIPRGAHVNKVNYPPVKFYHFSSKSWKVGIENYQMGGHKVKVYGLAKTIVDCFKFRNKIGMDVVRGALKLAITEKNVKPKDIMQYAKACRVDGVIKPILEAML